MFESGSGPDHMYFCTVIARPSFMQEGRPGSVRWSGGLLHEGGDAITLRPARAPAALLLYR